MTTHKAIVMLAKYPLKGFVKTRLAKSWNEEGAYQLYDSFLNDIISTVNNLPYPYHVAITPANYIESFKKNYPVSSVFPQSEGSLGDRIFNAFNYGFSQGADTVIVIGSDCIEMTEPLFKQAFYALTSHDIVLGPSYDGGYYLMGAHKKSCVEVLFNDIAWSTANVFLQTKQRCEQQGYTYRVLPYRHDIDTLEDLRQLSYRIDDQYPRTAAYIRNLCI